MNSAARLLTKPAAGVMATSPATAPEAAPSVVACLVVTFSTAIHPSRPMHAASCVLTSAWAATLPADRADPALKPNQPNQSTPAPTRVSGSECGGIGSPGQPRRRPRTIASARADAPEFISTTEPPAKSSTPICASQPFGENTQWARGTYTTSAHSAVKVRKLPNFIRSAPVPASSAAVITQNIIWKAAKAIGGIVSVYPGTGSCALAKPANFSPPMKPPPPEPKARV